MMSSAAPVYNTLICDFGDVLFSWSANTKSTISPKVLRKILSSPTWFEYECGRLSEKACYERIGHEFGFEPSEVANAFSQARDSLQPNDKLIAIIRELKAQSGGNLRVFAMSNISLPDYAVLRKKTADWDIFDRVFTSGAAGERKPNLSFYRHVLNETKTNPQNAIFLDDKSENVLSARSVGIHGIVFDDMNKVARALRNLVGNPIQRGQDFLNSNAKTLNSITNNDITLEENFAQLLILEATHDRNLIAIEEHPRTWNFFIGKPLLTTEQFPADLDTTSLGLTITRQDPNMVQSVMDEMLEYLNSDGIIQTYFDHSRPRFDPVVCINVLNLFYTHGRGHELRHTLEWVYEVLLHRAYLEGTRYYSTPECFLFFLSRFIGSSSSHSELHQHFTPLLKERIQERIGAEGDALALAMRILVCKTVGIRDDIDLRALLPLQCDDGGWEASWIYKYGSSGISIGNRGLTTALAINAIKAMDEPLPPQPRPTTARSRFARRKSVCDTSFYQRASLDLSSAHAKGHSKGHHLRNASLDLSAGDRNVSTGKRREVLRPLRWFFPGQKAQASC